VDAELYPKCEDITVAQV